MMRKGALVLALAALLASVPGCARFEKRLAMAEGNKAYKAQQYEEAIGHYRKILDRNEFDWTARWMTAICYVALYHPGSTHPKDIEYSNKAIEHFEKMLMLKPPSHEEQEKVRTYYVATLVSADKTEKALAYYQLMLKKDPDNIGLIQKVASLQDTLGDFPAAVATYERVTQLQPQNKLGWYTIGVLCWKKSNKGGMMVADTDREQIIQKGTAALEKALEIEPDYFDALSYINLIYREKAGLLHRQAKYLEAQEALKTADDYRNKAMALRKTKTGGSQPAAGQPGATAVPAAAAPVAEAGPAGGAGGN